MEIGFLTMEKVANRGLNTVGSSRIRARWLCKYWDEAEEFIIGKNYDVVVLQKAWWENFIEEFDGIKIFDICDPDWIESRRSYVKLLSQCDAVVVNTDKMQEYLQRLLPGIPVVVIPDRLDIEEHQMYKEKHAGVAQSCVWFGYSHGFHYIEKTLPHVLKKNLSLTIIADKSLQLNPEFAGLKFRNVKYNYKTVHEEIIKHDIALLPETRTDFKGQFKSNNKLLTAWALGLPVAERLPELEKFMHAEERQKEADRKREKVLREYDVKQSVEDYKKLIHDIKNRKG